MSFTESADSALWLEDGQNLCCLPPLGDAESKVSGSDKRIREVLSRLKKWKKLPPPSNVARQVQQASQPAGAVLPRIWHAVHAAMHAACSLQHLFVFTS